MTHTTAKVPLHVLTGVVDIIQRGWGIFAVLYGSAIIIGGAERWGASQFQVAITAPGAPTSWGITLVVLGAGAVLSSLYGNHVTDIVFQALEGFWWSVFAAAFVAAAARDETASWTVVLSSFAFSFLYYSSAFITKVHATWAADAARDS